MVIGITGGIGSGKSTIARALEARGYKVYDCDREAKRIIAEDPDVQQQIIALLGPESFIIPAGKPCIQLSPEKSGLSLVYNTAYVAQRVFAEPELLEQLNAIVHPAVKADILSLISSTGNSGEAFRLAASHLFIESAILFEAGLNGLCDKIFIVDAPEDIRIARTIARDYNGEATPDNINKVRARIHAQTPPSSTSHFPSQNFATHHPSPATGHTISGTYIPASYTILNDGRTPIDDLASLILQNI